VIWIVLLGWLALSVLCCAFYVLGAGIARRALREATDNWTHPPPEEGTHDRDPPRSATTDGRPRGQDSGHRR
jgi:hypothetical protein